MGLFSNKSYYKPGKGVEKDAPQKNAFFHFFELYGRKFWRFIEVNFIYLLVLLPGALLSLVGCPVFYYLSRQIAKIGD